jgi:hypothetical protein
MSLKFKVVFFNVMVFLIIFDVIYLLVWILSIHMNPAKAVIVAGIAAILTPWVKLGDRNSERKVIIRSYVYSWYNKYLKK